MTHSRRSCEGISHNASYGWLVGYRARLYRLPREIL